MKASSLGQTAPTTTITATYKGGYGDQCRQMGIPEKFVPLCRDLLKYGVSPPATGHKPMTPDQMLTVVGPMMQAGAASALAVKPPQPPPTTPATVPPPTSIEPAPVPQPATALPSAAPAKKGPNWMLIGGIAGAGILAFMLLRK